MQPSPVTSSPPQGISAANNDLDKYLALAIEGGATHAKIIHPSSVVTAQWVRLKCQFGCFAYGTGHCCPPRTPTPEETRAILDSYRRAILIRIEIADSPERSAYYAKCFEALVELEGAMFKDGYYKAFVFLAGPCRMCKECTALENKLCTFPEKARPSLESCGIDVYQTVRNNGYFIQTLREQNETNNKYCLLMVD